MFPLISTSDYILGNGHHFDRQLLKGVCSISLDQKGMEICSTVWTFENKYERMVAGLGGEMIFQFLLLYDKLPQT